MAVEAFPFSYSLADLSARAREGYRWAWSVGYQVGLRGLDVQVSRFEIRAPDESPERFRFEIDMKVGLCGRWVDVEVKSKDSAVSPWPFPDVTCYGTRKGKRDLPVLFISTRTKEIVGLSDDGGERYVRMQRDGKRGSEYEVFAAPKLLLAPIDRWCEDVGKRLRPGLLRIAS